MFAGLRRTSLAAGIKIANTSQIISQFSLLQFQSIPAPKTLSTSPTPTPQLTLLQASLLTNQIFDTLPHPGPEYNHTYFVRSGNKVLRKNAKGPKIARYYFNKIDQFAKQQHPGFRDEIRMRR